MSLASEHPSQAAENCVAVRSSAWLGRAPLEKQMEWLKYEIQQLIDRIESQKTDALSLIAAPPKSRQPEITHAKLESRYGTLCDVGSRVQWLLGKRRPWMKRPNKQICNPEQMHSNPK